MKLWKRLILIPGVFVGTLAAFWTVIEVMNFFEHPLAQTIRTWNHGAGLWILLALSALLALLSPQILSESIVSAKILKPLASAIKWLIRQWRYILLTVLLVFLELTLYWLGGLKLVALSIVHLALVMLAVLLLFTLKWPMVASSLDATSGLVERIDFDYLPESPTSKGGGWVLFTEGEPPKFSTAKYLGEKALGVQKVDNYYLDRDVRTDPERCGRVVEYVTRLKSEGVVYAHIYVQSLDRSKSEKSWIQFKVGSRPPKKVGGNEWVLYITPKDELKEGWQLFRENLIDATEQTFGKEGKSFEQLIGFRLRGNLDLAYISVFES